MMFCREEDTLFILCVSSRNERREVSPLILQSVDDWGGTKVSVVLLRNWRLKTQDQMQVKYAENYEATKMCRVVQCLPHSRLRRYRSNQEVHTRNQLVKQTTDYCSQHFCYCGYYHPLTRME